MLMICLRISRCSEIFLHQMHKLLYRWHFQSLTSGRSRGLWNAVKVGGDVCKAPQQTEQPWSCTDLSAWTRGMSPRQSFQSLTLGSGQCTDHLIRCLQGSSTDRAASEAYRLERLDENGMAARPRQSLESGSSSFAALFGGNAQPLPFASGLARRDSQSSHISSRADDLGLNLDLPGLQVARTVCFAWVVSASRRSLHCASLKVTGAAVFVACRTGHLMQSANSGWWGGPANGERDQMRGDL